jgi:parallel beta-helix repeat protein
MNRNILGLVLVILLAGTSAFWTQTVRSDWTWTGTIYIRADGSVDPSNAPISTADDVTYTLTDNIVGAFSAGGSGDAIVVERDNIVVDGAGYTVQGAWTWNEPTEGIFLSGRTNVTVRNTQITGFAYGIVLLSSSNSSVSGNSVANGFEGIGLYRCSNSTVSENNVTGISYYGIMLSGSSHNSVSGNSVINNYLDGIWLTYDSNYNNICGNNIAANSNYGLSLYAGQGATTGNTISENNITANAYGILLCTGTNNMIYHNNFVGNNQQATGFSNEFHVWYNPPNVWDNGYPSGGNYWSDYGGVDAYYGPGQNITGSDRMGDTPYVINTTNLDHYPLTSPWSPHQLTVTSSPITGIPFTINAVSKTTPYSESLQEGHYYLEMPQTYNGYVWSHWLEDGGTSRIKTIYLHGTTWTGVYVLTSPPTPPVGGEWVPINKLQLLAPYISLISLMAILTTGFVYVRRKRQQNWTFPLFYTTLF